MVLVLILAALLIAGLLWHGGLSFSAVVAGTTLSGSILLQFLG
ncbi:hypothetical protein AB4Z01_11480 [Inquilinus sp. YAF38]